MADPFEDLRRQARERVREQYELAAGWRRVNLTALNRGGSPSTAYGSIEEVEREWLAAAGQVASFAVALGLITPDEARQILVDFCANHPELTVAE